MLRRCWFPAMCMSITEGNLMILLTIRNGYLPYVVQNERYASSGVSVLISFAWVSIVFVNSPFLQSHRQRKMAARFFLHGDHLAKVVVLGTPLLIPVQYDRTFLRPVQYDRTFLDSVQYGNLLNVFTNAIWMEQFSGYIILRYIARTYYRKGNYFQILRYSIYYGLKRL